MKILLIIAATLLCATNSAFGQPVSRKNNTKSAPSREIVAILNEARIASPELGIDIFLRVAEGNAARDTVWRREILEEALRRVDEVKYPLRRRAIPFLGVPVDTHGGYLSYAHDLKLDQLSLKSRIISQILKFDKLRARQIVFELGGQLKIKPLSCKDTLSYEVADIYRTVGEVIRGGFSSKEITEGIRAIYVNPWFENIESPAQIGPALDLLAEMRSGQNERQLLFNSLARSISVSFKDDRSFTNAVVYGQLARRVIKLVSGIDDPEKAQLRAAYRDFLSKNIHDSRCKDNGIAKGETLPGYIRDANFLYVEKPFTDDDLIPSDLTGEPDVVWYWRSSDAVRLQRIFRNLRDKRKAIDSDPDQSKELEWESGVSSFAEDLIAWEARDNESDSSVFNQKCVLFRTMIGLIPKGRLQKRTATSYLRFLNGSTIAKNSFIEWLLHVKWLANYDPALFTEIAEFAPNPHFKLLIDANRALSGLDNQRR